MYPLGLLAVPLRKVVRFHSTSGTTGVPIVAGYTNDDIELWSDIMARALTAVGTTKEDMVQIAYGYGLFTGGLGVHYGAERIGATVIPASGGNTRRQIMLMRDMGTTVLCCTPSYAVYLGETLSELGVEREQLRLKALVPGAEPWSESMRREIERLFDAKAYDIYGLTEVIGPGVAMECVAQSGLHIYEDHFYPEIIDPETGEPLPERAG